MAAGGGDDSEGSTRPPCLTMVRYMVAAVVTVLAVVVIVMVLTVDVFRPEKIRLSVLQGHVEATSLWKREATTPVVCIEAVGTGCLDIDFDLGGPDRPTTTVYRPTESVSFGLFLRADNPGGRADISCGNVTVRLLDMPHGRTNITGMTEVSQLKLLRSFVVKRMSSHTIKKWVSINDTSVTSHIATTYGGRTSFWGMVEVNMTIVSATPVAQTSPRYVRHSCGPLIVSVDEPSADAEAVQCIRRDREEDGLFS